MFDKDVPFLQKHFAPNLKAALMKGRNNFLCRQKVHQFEEMCIRDSHEGVGGVRHATFAGGVLFIETVDVWQPDRRLAFSIHAETTQIPAATLDEHVRVGGEFFNVLRGEYVIEDLQYCLLYTSRCV